MQSKNGPIKEFIENALEQWLRDEAKKRLYAEEAPTNCGSRGQLSTTSHFFRGSQYVPPMMTRGPIIFFTTLSFCSSVVIVITGDDGPFHLLTM
ncbi:hypothetical protein V1478_002329 [Vespula squamosa]|uniref:Uncharacterized protein n=1 Tax=Vespula squamosa TaxID=30214 RepID=A0ABD2BW53_VESSQ